MTEKKHLKALIRARMTRTGESYTAARGHIVAAPSEPSLTPFAAWKAHDKHCMTAVFLPDDTHVISGGFGGQARIWTLDGKPAGELAGHESSVNVIRMSSDGSLALTASSDKTVRTWDLPGRAQRAILGKHRKQVLSLDLDEANGLVWSGGHDGRLQRWDLESEALAATIDVGGSVTSVAVRRADSAIAVTTVGAGVSIRDQAGAEIERLTIGAEISTAAAWAADGSFLIVSSPGGATIWSASDWEPVRQLDSGSGGMLPVAMSVDGSRIALGWDNHLALWSADDDAPSVVIDDLPKGVYGLAFSHDDSKLAMAAADGRIRLYTVG